MTDVPLLAVTMGDPNGIGIEVTAKAWSLRKEERLSPFFLIGGREVIAAQLETFEPKVPLAEITSPEEARGVFSGALPLLPLDPTLNDAEQTIEAIRLGTELCRNRQVHALVTNPIHKKRLYEAGFTHPGHTEYLAALDERPGQSVMMLACPKLKVVPATVHIPIREVPAKLSADLLTRVIETTHADLKSRFGLENPRLAIAGLNPHAGEDGSIGDEEEMLLRPLIDKLCTNGMNITGPYAADSMFHAAAREKYDAAICMYHDQALIPIKTLDFDGGVNVTLGLSFIRTSPDHGTAEDIAGKGLANPASLIAAMHMAAAMTDKNND
ncbi:4-hydroxythreonine-4-phosphate dehydrogenase PdxA [Sneathiella sp. HT1-7]|uniref:4-hydroxythreonine-4-phosphate dehydrogenase PdxA n=1 Tax=Sneathiella sp. HT1-7 TaxID=2887192 RepID=UPI001D138202|nr:4-hydroxythreonine-4-phosphate dehydrogenase PdxA [Sneathiella sp. HT1-7]MCC3304865.1 4-hydroxythreonine-4-phosphate dehydrogenase PdxA [Sneathiella sp. HT1-7]